MNFYLSRSAKVRRTLMVISIMFTVVSLPAIAASCSHEFFRPYYKTRFEFCRSGELIIDFYTGNKIRCEDAEVDHVVSIREAYLGGVCGDDLKKLAKDPDNLRLTHWTINRQKGALPVEDFVSQARLSGDIQVRRVADNIRERYGVLSKDDAFSTHIANYFSRSRNGTKILPIAAVRSMKGIVKKQVGRRILIFSGTRLIGYTVGIGLAAETIMLIPDGFNALGRAVSTDDEVRRAVYIEELLK